MKRIWLYSGVIRFLPLLLALTASLVMLNRFPVLADGGEPQPTATPIPGAQSAPAPVVTSEVSTYEIQVNPGTEPTVVKIESGGQSLTYSESASTSTEDEFKSPIWICGFLFIVVIVLAINSAAKRIRKTM